MPPPKRQTSASAPSLESAVTDRGGLYGCSEVMLGFARPWSGELKQLLIDIVFFFLFLVNESFNPASVRDPPPVAQAKLLLRNRQWRPCTLAD